MCEEGFDGKVLEESYLALLLKNEEKEVSY